MLMIYHSFKTVFSTKRYRILGIASLLVFLMLYLLILPSTYTGGRIGLVSLRFLTPELIIFAVLFAVLMSMTISFTVFSYHKVREGGKTAAAGGFLVSSITPFLCCTPILPIVFGFLGGFIPLLSVSGGNAIQAFIALHEIELFAGAILLLIFALYQNAKAVIKVHACRING
ncbi:MAG: hypothetical protein IEMM0003_0917 [bacterium]|nr:MAG: hypothetical protein IEMM0003_0917 [bacterium]